VTFNALNLQVALGSSLACLSCHDGSVAINQSYGSSTPNQYGNTNGPGTAAYVPSWAVEAANGAGSFPSFGSPGPYSGYNSLTRMHPIGVNYVDAVSKDPQLQPIGGILDTAMLKGSGSTRTVECASCHDIHRTQGASMTVSHDLIVDLNNAQLCLTCHNK
jgi:predicted CXXCH cytochrome family protein